jgi:hypothetical protein
VKSNFGDVEIPWDCAKTFEAHPPGNSGNPLEILWGIGIANRESAGSGRGLGFLFDNDFELRCDAMNQPHGNQRLPEDFDGLVEDDAALVDLEPLCGQRLR